MFIINIKGEYFSVQRSRGKEELPVLHVFKLWVTSEYGHAIYWSLKQTEAKRYISQWLFKSFLLMKIISYKRGKSFMYVTNNNKKSKK